MKMFAFVIKLTLVAIVCLSGLALVAVPDSSAEPVQACSAATVVSTPAELDDAIGCYNAQTPVGDHTITFGADIVHAGGTPTVTQNDASRQLVISGADHSLTGPGAPTTSGVSFRC